VKRLLAAITLAGLVAGCGGASRLSGDAYRARLATIAKQADAAEHEVEQGLQAKKVADLHGRLAAFATTEQKLADEVAALKPPKNAEQANTALAQAEHDTAAAVRAVLPTVSHSKTPKQALQALQGNARAAKAGQELDSALSRLRKLGYTHGS
jgi:hypothetical protein